MALLPGYQAWGIAAVGLFILLRFVNGIFLGGQYTAANPLAMEYSPREKRGLYGAVINCGFPAAYVTIALVTLLLLSLMPSQGLDSAYVQWGWRIPFLIIAAVEFAFAAYYYFAVSESELWTGAAEHTEAPIKTLLRGENLKSFLQVFVLMSGLWLALQAVSAILPGVLGGPVGLSSTSVTLTLIVAFLMLIPANLAAGVISQRIGRRTFLMAIGIIMSIVATPLYYILISSTSQNLFVVILLAIAIVMLVDSPFALTPSYINERFATGVRSTGYGLGYSLAVILPSFYAFYQAGLSTFMPFEYTVLVFVVVGGLLITVGAALGPETKDVDLSSEVEAVDNNQRDASTNNIGASEDKV
jgi:MFS family permease